MAIWVDFRELRSKLKFADVLAHYQVQLKIRGDRATGFCPLPGHKNRDDGRKHSPSFSCNLARGLFQCFSCGGKGNLLDFACLMHGGNPDDPAAIRKTAVMLQEAFGLSSPRMATQTPASRPPLKQVFAHSNNRAPSGPVVVNAPLNFELKHLNPTHPYLLDRGFNNETIEHFGLGFCSKGMMADRIAIPLHNADGQLIGYAGRVVDDRTVNDENPKYRFPGTRERQGTRYEFHKSEFLYNRHRIETPVANLIVCEGFASVWWLWQHEFHNAVGVMGSSCSSEQATDIISLTHPSGTVTIFTDGDEAGERCAVSIFVKVAPHRTVRWARLSDAKQPTDCDRDQLNVLLQQPTD